MKGQICDDSTPVYQALIKALIKLVERRNIDKSFQDQEEVMAKAYFSTLEGLEALLIPLVYLPKNTVWDCLSQSSCRIQSILEEDVRWILTFNSKDQPPKEQGHPYFVHRKGTRQSAYWTLECASFTLSVLTNFLELCGKYGLDFSIPNEKIFKAIRSNLEWTKLCKRDAGWAWTTDSPVHPWPTWSLLDTFEEMKNCDYLTEFHEQIEDEIDPILEKIRRSFNTDVPGSYLRDWEDNIVDTKPYDVESALDLSRLMLAVSLHSPKSIVKPIAYKLYKWAKETDFSRVDYTCYLSTQKDVIQDSSLIPCVFRTLIVMAGILAPKIISRLDKDLGINHTIILHRVYNSLMKTQIEHGKFEGLWGVYDEGEGFKYELYYSERTIEALTEFLLHFPTEEIIKENNVGKDEEKEPREVTPFSNKPECTRDDKTTEDLIPAYLPILEAVASEAKRTSGIHVFEDTTIIYLLHFLSDLPPFIEEFYNLGCAYSDMYFLVKNYEYPKRDTIRQHLSSKGCQVVIPDNGEDETFSECTKQVLENALENFRRLNKRILIVEDGGHFAPLFHQPKYLNDSAACIGAVEQTTKGHRRDSEIREIKFPIISVATSRLKRALESEEVAATLQENVVEILRKYWKDKPIREHRVLIIGFGEIGSRLASDLLSKNMTVTVFDTNFEKKLKAEMIGKYKVLDKLDNLSDFTVIIGTSGETSIQHDATFWGFSHNTILMSGSSERVEFDLDALKRISQKVETDEVFTKYTLKKDNKVIRVLLDGQPMNFPLSEGISNAVIDPIYSEMFMSAVRLVSETGLKNGILELTEDEEKQVYELYKSYNRR